MDFLIYYLKAVSALEKVKSDRSYNERTIFDWKGKRMRRKLEKGYISGVNSAIKILKKVKKDYEKDYAEREMEYKETTSSQ